MNLTPSFQPQAAAAGQRPVGHVRWLPGLLTLAAILRLAFILVIDPRPAFSGGDVGWYLDTGLKLVTNQLSDPVQPGPVFLVYNGLVQLIFPSDPVLTLRLLNIAWHSALVIAVYVLGVHCFGISAARLAALVIATSPAFIIETGMPLTESLFLGILFGALAFYAWRQEKLSPRDAALVGLLLGLAALTRVVVLLFPALLALHMLRLHGWRRGARLVGVLLLAYALIVSTWTVYNLARWNRFIIGGEGLTAFAWMGVTGTTDPHAVDAQLGEAAQENQRDAVFIQGFLDALRRDLPGWLGRRAANLAGAYLQPHNTVFFPGESLKTLAANWLATDRSLEGLIALTQGDNFWPKLVLYLFHFWALGFGAAGLLLRLRRDFWLAAPLYGYVIYTTAIHLVLLAIPRYLFPVEPILYLFAASACGALAQAATALRRPRHKHA